MDAREAVALWALEPHPEGGFYRETYRSAISVAVPGWGGRRALATSILYLLEIGARSAWHRIRGDELWLWQGGAAMELTVGDTRRLLGPSPQHGEVLQVLVPAGEWQQATPAADASRARWSLAACVVVPGFDFADFELRTD